MKQIFLLYKEKNNKKINKDKSPWITNCILKSVRTKNRLYKTNLMNPTDRNEQIYKKYKPCYKICQENLLRKSVNQIQAKFQNGVENSQ